MGSKFKNLFTSAFFKFLCKIDFLVLPFYLKVALFLVFTVYRAVIFILKNRQCKKYFINLNCNKLRTEAKSWVFCNLFLFLNNFKLCFLRGLRIICDFFLYSFIHPLIHWLRIGFNQFVCMARKQIAT